MIHLNGLQRWTLVIAVTIIALMLLFPPFQVETKAAGVVYSGYGFLFNAPVHQYRPATINVATLAMQWVGVLLVAGLLVVLFANKKVSEAKRRDVPKSLPSETISGSQTPPSENPWPRFFARTFDVWWEILLVSIILLAVIPRHLWNDSPGTILFLTILYLPAALFLDALVFSIFGNTPGKALLGLKVVTADETAPGFSDYANRNFSIWMRGYALGIPLVFLFTMAYQYRRLSRGQQTGYDEVRGFRVLSRPASSISKIVFGFVFVVLFLLMGLIGKIGEVAVTKTTNISNTAEIYDPIAKPQGKTITRILNPSRGRAAGNTRIPTWDEIASSDLFKSLPSTEREQVRIDYFNDLMVPLIPKSQLDQARELFDKDTIPSALGLTSIDDFRRANPEFAQVPDGNLFDFIHQKYYPNTDKNDLARKFGYK